MIEECLINNFLTNSVISAGKHINRNNHDKEKMRIHTATQLFLRAAVMK